MANSNVNIANRLFAYIKHGVDISPEIKDVYNQSLILIGDEKQIYVPKYNAYVGISMTSYNITNDRIDALSDRLDELMDTLSQDLVSKIYPNYSLAEYQQLTGSVDSDDFLKMNNEITIKALGNYEVDPSKRTSGGNVITSYNLAQGTAHEDDQQSTRDITNSPTLFDDGQLYANSGITITAHYGGVQEFENPQTHQIIKKQVGNYIVIDDKQTWSYMTSAYSYTLNYAQQYTNSEVERLYHNLLGTGGKVFVPVSIDSVLIDVEDEFDKDSNNDPIIPDDVIAIPIAGTNPVEYDYFRYNDRGAAEYYIRKVNPTRPFYPDYPDRNPISGEGAQDEYVIISDSDLKAAITGGTASNDYVKYNSDETSRAIGVANVNQLYVLEDESVNTYNMNLRDGINTLKEVAYLLDQLTDGQLGKVTYYTYAQVTTAGSPFYTDNDAQYANSTYTVGTGKELYFIQPQNANPAADDIYAYVVNTTDPDNLGIQIAYSISGNKAQIDDLHSHVELDERGKTSLRSINTTETELASIVMRGGFSSFANASQTDKENGAYWANTDTNQAQEVNAFHPNNVATGLPAKDYRVGDVDIRLKLDLASTYSTVNNLVKNDYTETETAFGVKYRGSYQFADMSQLDANSTYYTYDATNGQMSEVSNSMLSSIDYDYTKLPEGTQYYWIPAEDQMTIVNNVNSINNEYLNLKVKEITGPEIADILATAEANSTTATIPGVARYNDGNGTVDYNYLFEKDANGNLTVVASGTDWLTSDAHNYFVAHPNAKLYYATEIQGVEYHPLIVEKNQIATTDWVGAYVDAKVSDVGDELENILDAAKQYTDDRIDALDSNYAYSDFIDNVWSYVQATENFVPGSSAYTSAYDALYNQYVNGSAINYSYSSSGSYVFSLDDYKDTLRNHAQSEYVYNVTEEDGIVSAEARELPSDRIIVENNIWGHEESDQPYSFLPLASVDADSPLLSTLYNWVQASSNDYPQNQLFVQDGLAYSKIAVDTEAAAATPTPTMQGGGLYTFNSYTGQYDIFTAPNGFDYRKPNSYLWVQLYEQTPKYVEIDLASAELPSGTAANATVASVNSLVFNDKYTLTKTGTSIAVTGATNSGLYYIGNGDNAPEVITHKVEYLTSSQKHFDYSNGGHGENELKVKANIVKLEDAKADNTGFADAFDVKTYIDNLFRWVDISASVDQSTLLSRDVFFRHITLAEYNAMETKPILYIKSGNNYVQSVAANETPATAWYYYSDNVCDPAMTSGTTSTSNTSGRGTVTINGNAYYARQEFDVNDYANSAFSLNNKYDSTCDYYINIETANINPLNLNITEYGKPEPQNP